MMLWTCSLAYLAFLVWSNRFQTTGVSKPGQEKDAAQEGPRLAWPGEASALRPGYHIIAPSGWMNDPVGMFEWESMTHVFYQANPKAAVWGSPDWGHVISSDLVRWKRLPPALVPSKSYDEDGVFSGSVAFLKNGTPVLLFTGVSHVHELHYFYQQSALALPRNYSDLEMKHWVKSPQPLDMRLPQHGTHAQFRDPTTPLFKEGKYWTAIGGAVDCVGSAMLYSSHNLTDWRLEGFLADQETSGTLTGECEATVERNPDGTWCQQFGKICQAWECPDIFELDGVTVLKYSDQVNNRQPFAADWYLLSDLPLQLDSISPNSPKGAFQASLGGKLQTPQLIDYGAVYASKTWKASDGRTLWVGWVYETAQGCFQQCAAGSPFIESLGWQGMLTVIREVTFDADSASLLFKPIREISQLRRRSLYDGKERLDGHAATMVLEAAQVPGLVQSQLLASFEIEHVSNAETARFGVGVTLNMSRSTSVTIYINGTICGTQVTEASVFIDRSQAGMYTNSTLEGGVMPLPDGGLRSSALKLEILFDHSLFEIFALGGRGRIASRVYAEDILQPDWKLSFWGHTSESDAIYVTAKLWEMEDCWFDSTYI